MSADREFVQLFSVRGRELEGMIGLTGGVAARHLRTATVTEAGFDALVEGLRDPNPRVRWWCTQVLDHVPDVRSIDALEPLLRDPVPRVRRNAAHALGCVACKPDWEGSLPGTVIARLAEMANNDENGKVRAQAHWALSCRV